MDIGARTKNSYFAILFAFVIFMLPSLAAASYQPGQTLNPTCPPSDNTCIVAASVATSTWSTSGSNLTYTNSGNVGIGTTSPYANLSVQGAAYGNGIVAVGVDPTTGYNTWLNFSPRVGAGSAVVQTTNNSPLSFGTNNTTDLTISTAGNVGIGTITPYSRLSVWGSDAASSTLAFNIVNSLSLIHISEPTRPY